MFLIQNVQRELVQGKKKDFHHWFFNTSLKPNNYPISFRDQPKIYQLHVPQSNLSWSVLFTYLLPHEA